jgi:photosystem II stability/assembly factor-like uncharacterized protein
MAWDAIKEEKFAELTRLARNKANTLGDDGYIVSEPFRRLNNVILGETWTQTPSAAGGLIPPSFDAYGVQGAVGSKFELTRLHSYLASGTTGPNSVQTFFVISDIPTSHGVDAIESVRRKNLISPEFSINKSNAAENDPNVRGFELALYPAISGDGLGSALVADVSNGPIPISADPSATYGLGENSWDVDYMNGIVRFSAPPLNGPTGVMNPNNVFGDIDGSEIEDAYGAITMFATYYQYTGSFGDTDESNFVVVGDGYISNGTFEGGSHNAIQLALDSLSNGGTVFIKEGDYTFTDSVTVGEKKSVVGLNGRVNILAPANSAAFDITGSNVTLEGLPIRTTNSSTGGSCFELSGSLAGDTLENIQIKNNILYCKNDAYGVEFSPNADNITYKNVEIRNNVFKDEPDNDSVWVAVGNPGEIQTSPDGTNWTARAADSGFVDPFQAIAHDGSGLWCAVGESAIQTSSDGITWTSRTVAGGFGDVFHGIAYDGSGLWCAVGESGEIQTSPDGITWTAQTAAGGFGNAFFAIAHDGSGLWCAVGELGEIQTSPDGITWTEQTTSGDPTNQILGIAHDGAGLWAAASETGQIQTSPDGVIWTLQTVGGGFTDTFQAIAHDGSGLWCAVGNTGEIQTSPDGVTWTVRTVDGAFVDTFQGVYHDGSGLWCAVGESGEIQTSPDGIIWTAQTADAAFADAFQNVSFQPSAPIYIGEKFEDGYSSFENVSITENQFEDPTRGIGTILLNSHAFKISDLLISQNTGKPRLDLTGIDGYMHEVIVTNNSLKSVSVGDFTRSSFNSNVVQGNVTFTGLERSSVSNNYIGGFFTSPSIIRTNMVGNYVASTDLDISTSMHIWDGYISADGPNVYVNDNLLPKTTGQELGSRNNRWDGYFTRVDIGDATTVITDGYIRSDRDLEVSAGLNDISLHSRMVHNGPNDNSVVIDNGEVRVTDGSGTTVLRDGYLELADGGVDLEVSAGPDDIKLYSKTIHIGPRFFAANNWISRTAADNFSGAFSAIAHNGSDLWAAVGTTGEIQTSPDGINWTAQTPDSSFSGTFGGIAHNGSDLWIAVGATGTIQTSPDGITWTSRTPDSSFAGTFNGIAYNGSDLWCAVGASGTIQTSPDGITWTSRTPDSGFGSTFNEIAHNGSDLWVVVGAIGQLQTSPDGITWTTRTAGGTFSGIAHNGSDLWCAVGAGGTIQTSPGGITWTTRTSGTASQLQGVVHNGSDLWCAVGASGTIITSPDGITWSAQTAGSSYSGFFNGVTYSGFTWAAVGSAGEIQTSLDNKTITMNNGTITFEDDGYLKSASGNLDISAGQTSDIILHSKTILRDGYFESDEVDLNISAGLNDINLYSKTTHHGPGPGFDNKVTLDNGEVQVTDVSGTTVLRDGYLDSEGEGTDLGISAGLNDINLYSKTVHHGPGSGVDTLVTIDNGEVRLGSGTTVLRDGYLDSEAEGTDLGISAGLNDINLYSKTVHHGPGAGSDTLVTINNGDILLENSLGTIDIKSFLLALGPSNWTARTPDASFAGILFAVAHDESNLWAITGGGGEIQTSPDGTTWTQRTADKSYSGNFQGISHGFNRWVAVGGSGEIQASPDGVTWVRQTTDASYTGDFFDVANNGSNLWVAVGSLGEIQTSTDGYSWTERTPAASFADNFDGIAYNGSDLWCAVGATGEIQTSDDGADWTQRTSDGPFTGDFRSVAHDQSGLWVAVGDSGEIQTSPDGITWTARIPDKSSTNSFIGVAHDGKGMWAITGGGGEIQTSPDGITWTQRVPDASFSSVFRGIANDKSGLWIVVGSSAEIQTSLRLPL